MKQLLIIFIIRFCAAAQSTDALELADAAFRERQFERAAALARSVLARQPGAVHAHMILGVIAAQKNDWESSNRHFQMIVRLEPSNPYGYFYLGQAKLYQHEWDAAAQLFSKALERQYPDTPRLLVELALARNESGNPREALEVLRKTAPPADARLAAQYHAIAAFALQKLDQPDAAIDEVQQALQLSEDTPENWELLIAELIKTDQAPRAVAEAIRAQKKFPDHPGVQFLFALANYYVAESPLSHLALRNLREAEPNSPRVLLAEGFFQRKTGRNEEALATFQRAARAGVPDAHLLLGILYKESGDYPAAEREYRAAERLNPNNGQVQLELGKLLLTRGELEQARLRLEKAAQLMPRAQSVHYQLGLLYRRMGQLEKAEQHFRLAK
jgi:Flp pilus assembly protein TadD